MKYVLVIVLLACSLQSHSQVKKYLRKAESANFSGDFQKGRDYYIKAVELDKSNYKANLGAGITLAYYLEDLEQSLPYLETALTLSTKDTATELLYALGKTYHYFAQYEKALSYYEQMKNYEEPGNDMYEPELSKRIADCRYGMANPKLTDPAKWYVVNAGKSINTQMPEYVPVLIGKDKMIFTSKRKDDKREKINKDNGKYFESMYITDINNGYTSSPSRYSIPDKNVKGRFKNDNESVVSMMPKAKKIFIYKDRQLYEGDLSATTNEPEKISRTINFDKYQNHAVMEETGQVLYFTSESEKGFGGNDIYRSVKQSDGSWGTPENLGETINTAFEEESPFMSEDGKTLYFASTGHPGYGGFDIYQSTFENGKWSEPLNLGQPLNSPANDLFFVSSEDGAVGYMSSSRKGGQGDMDIYKINYTDKLPKECNGVNKDKFAVDLHEISPGSTRYNVSVMLPEVIRDKVLSMELKIDDVPVNATADGIAYDFSPGKQHSLKAKVVAWCDTCINLYIACAERTISLPGIETLPDLANNTVHTEAPTAGLHGEPMPLPAELENVHGELNESALGKLGLDLSPLYFDKNTFDLRADALTSLEKNISFLKAHPELKLVINGYADARGDENYNKRLSEKRAAKVRAYLKSRSLKNPIEIIGKGETELTNSCGDNADCDESMHRQNRRAVMKVIKK
jgi:outer membrane protein OmpA-like peptidoglycan-associated protein/tetratricopeptide (TPR) repeat protein